MLYNKFLIVVLFFVFSCSKKENTPVETNPSVSQKVSLVIEVNNGTLIHISTISNGENNSKTESFTNLTSFQKEYKSISVVNVVAKGVDSSSKLTVKLMNGEKVIKEAISTGTEMSSNIINLN